MTNSTEATNSPAKPKKAKGPIRLEAVIPIAIIFALVLAYFKIFFDGHLRSLIEWTGTKVHGAEVNVADINTSFLGGSFELRGLQVTDKNKPHRNLFSVGMIRFQFLWDALLRAKFVVNDASIKDIQALTPRQSPGRVMPPEPDSGKEGSLAKIQDKVLDQAKSQYNANMLGDVASILGGVDPKDQLKAIEGELKSSGKLKQLEAELKEKEKVWKERIKSLPQAKDVDALNKRLKALKFDAKNPIEFANNVKEADKILKEADQKIKLVSETGKNINQDVNTYQAAFKELEKMVDEDLKDMQARLKIPDVNAGDFTKTMFMRMFQEKLVGVKKYAEVAKQYMPPKRAEGEKPEEIVPRPRGTGRDFRFPITTGYPLFWLQHASISSTVSSSAEYSGNIEGSVKDVTSDPQYLKKPSVIALKGDFPKQSIGGLDFRATLDHTTDIAKADIVTKIASYPVDQQKLSDSSDVRFQIEEATGGLDLTANLTGEALDVKMTTAFTQLKYGIEAKSNLLQDMLTKVMAGIPMIDLRARAHGTWSDIDFDLSSNLGDELARGIKAQVQAKIDEARAKLKAMINDKIGVEKQRLTAEFEKLKGEVTGEVSKVQNEIEKAKKTAQADIDAQKKKGGSKKLEDEGKKLLKKLKIGG